MVKTRSRPVISKIFVMLRSLQTSESSPSFDRSRFTPPTRTPSVVESMKVVSVKSTITCLAPWPITSRSCALNSGAVYRSTSPASEITYPPSSSCSVLMSKFTASSPIVPGLCPRARSLTLRAARHLRLERLDLLLRVRHLVVERRELDELLVGRDRRRRLARVLGRLRELQLRGRLGGLQLRDLRVDVRKGGGGRLPGVEGLLVLLLRAAARGRCERVLDAAERPTERRRVGRGEGRPLGALDGSQRGLGFLGLDRALLRVVRRELRQPVDVPGPKLRVRLPGADGVVEVALRVVGSCEVVPRLGVLRVLLGLLQRLAHRRSPAASADAAEDVAQPADVRRSDSEEDEAAGEDDREEDEHPLRLLADAIEEQRVLVPLSSRVLVAPTALLVAHRWAALRRGACHVANKPSVLRRRPIASRMRRRSRPAPFASSRRTARPREPSRRGRGARARAPRPPRTRGSGRCRTSPGRRSRRYSERRPRRAAAADAPRASAPPPYARSRPA